MYNKERQTKFKISIKARRGRGKVMVNRRIILISILCFLLGFVLIGCDTISNEPPSSSGAIENEDLDKDQNVPEDKYDEELGDSEEIPDKEEDRADKIEDAENDNNEIEDTENNDDIEDAENNDDIDNDKIEDKENNNDEEINNDEETKNETDKDEVKDEIDEDDINNEDEEEKEEEIDIDFRELPRVRAIKVKVKVEDDIVKFVNELRTANGIEPLESDSKLIETARYKSNAMTQLNYFSHENPNYENKRTGYLLWDVFNIDATYVAENIAYRSSTIEANLTGKEVFEMWEKSPGHRANMLKKDFKKIGVGIISSNDKDGYYVHATQHFSN